MGCVKSSREITVKKQTLIESKTKEEKDENIGVKNFIKGPEKNLEDNYKILSKIGKGTFGKVYEVKNKKTNQIRAMKTIKK